jgi:hypothetical protein
MLSGGGIQHLPDFADDDVQVFILFETSLLRFGCRPTRVEVTADRYPVPTGKKAALDYLGDEDYIEGYQRGYTLVSMVNVMCPDTLLVIRRLDGHLSWSVGRVGAESWKKLKKRRAVSTFPLIRMWPVLSAPSKSWIAVRSRYMLSGSVSMMTSGFWLLSGVNDAVASVIEMRRVWSSILSSYSPSAS